MDTCGAKTRAGTPCKQKAIYWNGRCKFHGGLATGPTTEAGKEQCRINGRKGGRPRKAGPEEAEAVSQQDARLLKDVRVSEAAILAPNGDPKITLSSHGIPCGHILSIVSNPQSPVSTPVLAGAETEIIELEKTSVSEELSGDELEIFPMFEMSIDVHVLAAQKQLEIIPDKPKSWMLKEVMVLPRCERCEMFASNGACLAVAKGVIPCIPTSEPCAAFSDFGKT